ncbi:MAG: hypothetical protein BAJALOKI1v1_1090003 [Promethearchaeota archaeon]|nr:MAG: hypothetical protein BAJALOKI1v1_1090003 [Candidatus Lokiarchaeota archaeon]
MDFNEVIITLKGGPKKEYPFCPKCLHFPFLNTLFIQQEKALGLHSEYLLRHTYYLF